MTGGTPEQMLEQAKTYLQPANPDPAGMTPEAAQQELAMAMPKLAAGGEQAKQARERIVAIMAAQLQISPADAAERFDDAQAQLATTARQAMETAKVAANQTASAASSAAFLGFVALVLGGAAAVFGGSFAVQRRVAPAQVVGRGRVDLRSGAEADGPLAYPSRRSPTRHVPRGLQQGSLNVDRGADRIGLIAGFIASKLINKTGTGSSSTSYSAWWARSSAASCSTSSVPPRSPASTSTACSLRFWRRAVLVVYHAVIGDALSSEPDSDCALAERGRRPRPLILECARRTGCVPSRASHPASIETP